MATKRLSDKTSLVNSFKMGMGAASAAVPTAPIIGTATKTGGTTATVAYTCLLNKSDRADQKKGVRVVG